MQKQNKAKVMPMNAAFSGLLYTGSFRSTDNGVFQDHGSSPCTCPSNCSPVSEQRHS